MKLTWRQFEAFRAIMKTGSVTLAADAIAVSQPAVSTLLSNLEGELGYQLFFRERGRLVPTKEAEALFSAVDRAFVGLDEIVTSARAIGQLQQGLLRVAVMPSLAGRFVTDIIAEFLRVHENISLVFDVQPRLTALNWVLTDRCDIAITSEPAGSSEINAVSLSTGTAVCLIHRDHVLAKKSAISAGDLHGQRLICLPPETRISRRLEALLEDAGSVPVNRIQCRSTKPIWDLVDRNLGISVVTDFPFATSRGENVVVRAFVPAIQTGICMATSRVRPLSQIARAFNDFVIESFRNTSNSSATGKSA